MKIILSSKGIENKKIEKAFLKLIPKKENLKVVIITTASIEYKENDYNAIKAKNRFEILNFEVTFLDIEYEKADILDNADIIFINGGNPYFLLYHINENNIKDNLEKAINNKAIIIGSSAGALVLTKSIKIIDLFTPEQNIINLKNLKALNFINLEILPHFDKYVSRGIIKNELVKKYELKNNTIITKINENDALFIDNERQYFINQ